MNLAEEKINRGCFQAFHHHAKKSCNAHSLRRGGSTKRNTNGKGLGSGGFARGIDECVEWGKRTIEPLYPVNVLNTKWCPTL